mmetsp:Transcript_56710/g.90184  ORF Transcript_56710/g.90184 Transcript_56710/m.90184 type:complete len:512 (+) Transcript_56710:43-1578(+)
MVLFRHLSPKIAETHESVMSVVFMNRCWLVIALSVIIMLFMRMRRMSASYLFQRLRSYHRRSSQDRGCIVRNIQRSCLSASVPHRQKCILLPGNVHSRDIELQVSTHSGLKVALILDVLSPGEILRRQVTLALGMEPSSLCLPCGKYLDLAKSLNTQGIKSGDQLVAVFPNNVQTLQHTLVPAQERRVEEIKRFRYSLYTSEVSPQQDHFELSVSISQEPDAMKEAEDSSTRVEFTETSFSLLIQGESKNYILRRQIGEEGAIRGDVLPVGFSLLCPPRCSYTLMPKRKLTVVLRPYPENWLSVGTRVKLIDLREACELNAMPGTITGFFEGGGQFLPSRYGVKLDNGLLRKIRRENLQQLSLPSDATTKSDDAMHLCMNIHSVAIDTKQTSFTESGNERISTQSAKKQTHNEEYEYIAEEAPSLGELVADGDVAGGIRQPPTAQATSPTRSECEPWHGKALERVVAGHEDGGSQARLHLDESFTKKSKGALAWSKRRRENGGEDLIELLL